MEYQDTKMGITVHRLDGDLENRWAISGVAVKLVDSGSKAEQVGIEIGDLLSHITGEIPLTSGISFNRIVNKAMKKDNQVAFELSDGTRIKLSVRRRGDKPGLTVKASGEITDIVLDSPAEKAGLFIGQKISSVIDERNIESVEDYKKAVKDFSKYQKPIIFQTTELSGVKVAVVKALSQLNNQSALDQLIAHVEEKDGPLRQPAVVALEQLVATAAGSQSSTFNQKIMKDGRISDLTQRYMQRIYEPNPEIRRSCLSILSALKTTSAIPELITVVKDEAEIPGIRFKAGSTLSQIGTQAVEPLMVAYANGNANVKDIVASALGNINSESAKRMLFSAISTEQNPTVQLTLADAIAKFNDEESKQKLSNLRSDLQGNSGLQVFIDELLRPKANIEAELDEEEEFEL
ncbi:HEAT repeat domain-containing protein [Candidatus Poribacteria bacterium]|nr:HEAT repeat domain-containing protein [Candidatus Poribacteria bacterium]